MLIEQAKKKKKSSILERTLALTVTLRLVVTKSTVHACLNRYVCVCVQAIASSYCNIFQYIAHSPNVQQVCGINQTAKYPSVSDSNYCFPRCDQGGRYNRCCPGEDGPVKPLSEDRATAGGRTHGRPRRPTCRANAAGSILYAVLGCTDRNGGSSGQNHSILAQIYPSDAKPEGFAICVYLSIRSHNISSQVSDV